MPISCPSCTTQNPDGNAFCAHCGAPLATAPAGSATGVTPTPAPASVPTPPPAAPAPTPAAQPAAPVPQAVAAPVPVPVPVAQPPASVAQTVAPTYYAQPGTTPWVAAPLAAAPVHRTSSAMIIAAGAIAVVVVGAVGGIIALAHTGQKTPVPPAPIAAVPTQQPTPPPQQSSPPQQTSPPTSAPAAPGGSSASDVTTAFGTVPVPTGFTVASQTDQSVELDPIGGGPGQIFISAVSLNQAESNDALGQAILTQVDAPPTWPDAALCGGKAAVAVTLAGSSGPLPAIAESICGHYTPQSGQAFAAVDFYAAAVITSSSGSAEAVSIEIFCPSDSYQAFTATIPDSFYSGVQFNGTAPSS